MPQLSEPITKEQLFSILSNPEDQTYQNGLTVALDAGKISIINGWITLQVDECTCENDSMYGHRVYCGFEPLQRIGNPQ